MLFVKPEVYALLDSDEIHKLREALQVAVRLEHSTMPPYLYALYSLAGTNPDARLALKSIVEEEMLHMLLACNILNALGEAPKIDEPSFVPSYPTPLPGTVAQGLQVPIQRFSKQLVQDVFMVIEEPEDPLKIPTMRTLALPDEAPPRTIGQFYSRIKEKILTIAGPYFTGNSKRQVVTPLLQMPVADQRVTGPESAAAAIDYIVHQGEGTTDSPNFDGTEFAHYYRFEELAKGLRLQPNPNATQATPPDERYQFGPVTIAIDESVVLPLPSNPKSADYPAGPIRNAADDCNRIYTQVLAFLQEAFDGKPAQIDPAITMMKEKLKPAAEYVTSFDLNDQTRAGPTFEYLK